MDENVILNVGSDVISLILSFIIHDVEDFKRFSKLLMVWATKRSSHRIKDVLERLNWDALYQFYQHPMEVTRDQFHGFISFDVRNNVQQAMFYNSVQKPFLKENVYVLGFLSGSHFPSSFCFIFFKAIYRTFERTDPAREMHKLLNIKYLRGRLLELLCLLQDMYKYISERDYLLPVYKFCPNARNPDPIYRIEGHPLGEELWYSLCHKTVEASFREGGEAYGKPLRMSLIWESDYEFCRVQLILFKIFLSVGRD